MMVHTASFREFVTEYCDLCRWSLKTVGFAIGWLGVTYRTAAAMVLSLTITKTPDEDPDVYVVLYSIALTYSLLSLAADFLLIAGINQQKPHYFIPYLSIELIEVCTGSVLFIAGIVLLAKTDNVPMLYWYIPVSLVVLGIYVYLWYCLLKLFKRCERALEESEENVLNLFQCNFRFSTNSLNIPT